MPPELGEVEHPLSLQYSTRNRTVHSAAVCADHLVNRCQEHPLHRVVEQYKVGVREVRPSPFIEDERIGLGSWQGPLVEDPLILGPSLRRSGQGAPVELVS